MRYKGIYHGQYGVEFKETPSSLKAKRAFVMPGQGSSYPGMFSAQLQSTQEFKKYFQIADHICSYFDLLPISHYLTNPSVLPKEQMHIYRNCALFCVEVAAAEYLLNKDIQVSAVTGHSFGECAGLVLCGIIDFETMFSVVVHRNLACPPANDLGVMIALTGTIEKIDEVMKIPQTYLANTNSAKQLVISVGAASKDKVIQTLRKARIPHIPLNQLPQPYHSPLMEPYRLKIEERIKSLRITPNKPKYDFYSGVSHSWITSENYNQVNYVELLAKQITEPVDFVDQIQALRERGINSFYEVGPGKMLATSIQSILTDQQINIRNFETVFSQFERKESENIEMDMKLVESPWFKKIKNVIQTVTGYKSEDINIAHSFQKDLGIDSIKKAEILFKIINQESMGASSDFAITRFNSIYQAVEYLENYSDVVDPLRKNHETKIELLSGEWLLDHSYQNHVFDKAKSNYEIIRKPFSVDFLNEAYPEIIKADNKGLRPILAIELHEAAAPEFIEKFHNSYKQFMSKNPPKFGICLIDRTLNKEFFGFAGLWKSLRKENGKSIVCYIHSPEDSLTDQQIFRDYSFSPLRDIRYENGIRYINDFKSLTLKEEGGKVRPSCKVVAVGGSKGIGFEILSRFPVNEGDSLLLLGRTEVEHPEIALQLSQLQKYWPEFAYKKIDAFDYDSLEKAVSDFAGANKGIDFVINSCGYETSQIFETRDNESIAGEVKSKILPAQNILKLNEHFKIGKMLHFTSAVSQFGNKGQAVYAYSNGVIEQLCSQHKNAHAVAWGPWEKVGMTMNEGILQKIREWGISLISPEVGAQLTFQMLFAKTLPSTIVVMDFKDIFLFNVDRYKTGTDSPILGEIQNGFEAVFYKEIDLKREAYLGEHLILKKHVIPGAYFLAQIMALSRVQFCRLVGIEKFSIQNLLILEDGYGYAKLQGFFRPPHEFSIYSLVPHCAGNYNPEMMPAMTQSPPYQPTHNLDLNAMYNDGIFDFGTKFQVVQAATVDEKQQVRLNIDTELWPKLSGDLFFDFFLACFETAFQSMTLQASFTKGAVTLPSSVGKVIFDSSIEVTRHISMLPIVKKIQEKNMVADVLMVNSHGQTFCMYQDVQVTLHYFDNAKPIPKKSISHESLQMQI